ncbi:MAG: MotA/TolQ/ExbB proton channel family protein [Kiritimatiellia bacterium]
MMKRFWIPLAATCFLFMGSQVLSLRAQDAAAPAAPAAVAPVAAGPTAASSPASATTTQLDTSFWAVMTGSGWAGVVLWIFLFASSAAGIALGIDSFMNVQAKKIMPATLIDKVKTAMEQGDVMKALKNCEEEPGPLANILSAGFSNVEEGFESIQDAVGVAADLETEKLIQRISYLNVTGNIAPMLGLLGTVQGMIVAFATLATGGAAASGMLALAISQALWTTAYGLCVAIPCMGLYYYFRNSASRIILTMEGLTMDQIKILRNVEVVES